MVGDYQRRFIAPIKNEPGRSTQGNLTHFDLLRHPQKNPEFFKKPVASAPILLDMGRFLCGKLVAEPPILH